VVLRRVIVGGLAVFLVLVAVQHPLRAQDLPPAEHFISEYAKGSTAVLQIVAFVAWALALGAGAVLAWRARARPATPRPLAGGLTAAALGVASAGTLMAAVFATQTVAGELPPGRARTLEGRLHDLGTLGLFLGLLVAALASARLIPGARYRVVLALLAVVLLAVVPVLVALELDAPGFGQRAFALIGCAFLWRFAVAASGPPRRR